MKKPTILLVLAACLGAAPAMAQSFVQNAAQNQIRSSGFSDTFIAKVSRRSIDPYRTLSDAPQYLGQSATLPPITASPGAARPAPVAALPPITAPAGGSTPSAPVVKSLPVPKERLGRPSGGGAYGGSQEIYSQEEVRLPPVSSLPVPSRTTLPPITRDSMMLVPLGEAVTRILAANMAGLTGLITTTSADVSKAGSFKMGFHSSWFNLDRVYDRVLASGESGEILEMPIYFNYAVTDDLEFAYMLPVLNHTIKSRILWSKDFRESGVGDSKLSFKYRVFDNAQYQMRGAFGIGFKFPTGSDQKGLGTGKTDFEIYTAFSKNFERVVAHLNLGYVMTGDPNTQFYPDGLADVFYYNIGLEYPHNHNVTIMTEVNGQDWGAEGLKVDVVPGLRYTPTENFAVDIAVPIAVTNDQRLGYNYRVVTGVTAFFR